jgi:hypothetical protein
MAINVLICVCSTVFHLHWKCLPQSRLAKFIIASTHFRSEPKNYIKLKHKNLLLGMKLDLKLIMLYISRCVCWNLKFWVFQFLRSKWILLFHELGLTNKNTASRTPWFAVTLFLRIKHYLDQTLETNLNTNTKVNGYRRLPPNYRHAYSSRNKTNPVGTKKKMLNISGIFTIRLVSV